MQKTKQVKKNTESNKNELLAALIVSWWHTLFAFLRFFSLVIGSGGVAVEEVVACIAEGSIVTRRANQRRSITTQTTLTRCRRDWRQRRKNNAENEG